MATHIIGFPGADIHSTKIKSTSGDIASDGDISLLSSGTTNVTIKSDGNVGIGTLTPSFKLDVNGDINFSGTLYQSGSTNFTVQGGTIINSDRVAKKTYSYYGQLASAQTIANSTIKITFSNHVFYAKVVAHLVETDDEVSTLAFECGGGNWSGSAPANNIALGPVSVFGGTSTNPWNSSITTTGTTVAFAPTTNMATAGHYNIFIEYISQSSSGVVSKITEGTNDEITFDY